MPLFIKSPLWIKKAQFGQIKKLRFVQFNHAGNYYYLKFGLFLHNDFIKNPKWQKNAWYKNLMAAFSIIVIMNLLMKWLSCYALFKCNVSNSPHNSLTIVNRKKPFDKGDLACNNFTKPTPGCTIKMHGTILMQFVMRKPHIIRELVSCYWNIVLQLFTQKRLTEANFSILTFRAQC